MANRPQTRTALIAASLLIGSVTSFGGATATATSGQVKADKGQTAFFERPVALAAARHSSTPYPLVIMLTTDPWLMVIGSDSPSFALYSDGTTIFRTKAGLQATKLGKEQMDGVVQAFENPDLAALAGRYEATAWTDQPDNNLLVYGRGTPFFISVYGSLADPALRSNLPAPIVRAFDRLRNFTATDAQGWLPQNVEVMVWPYEYAPDKSIAWPKRWPDLYDRTTVGRGDSYSIFMSATELPALEAFLATRKERGAIEINGKKWAVSVRLPFPHEPLWMAPATK